MHPSGVKHVDFIRSGRQRFDTYEAGTLSVSFLADVFDITQRLTWLECTVFNAMLDDVLGTCGVQPRNVSGSQIDIKYIPLLFGLVDLLQQRGAGRVHVDTDEAHALHDHFVEWLHQAFLVDIVLIHADT